MCSCSGMPKPLRSQQPQAWTAWEHPSIHPSFTPNSSVELSSAKSHSSLLPAARRSSAVSPGETRHREEDLPEMARLAGRRALRPRTEMNQLRRKGWPRKPPLGPSRQRWEGDLQLPRIPLMMQKRD